jgi:hypothetical protein
MEKTIKVGDKELNLRIKLGTFKRLQDITGVDGIEYVKGVGGNPISGTANLLLAACQTYDAHHKTAQINKEDLDALMDDAEMNVINDVVNLYVEFLNPGGTGEDQTKVGSPSPSRQLKN